MNCSVFYVFKCGCSFKSFHGIGVNRNKILYVRRFCPKCFDPALSGRAAKNMACSLAWIESECKKCGEATRLSKNATTNTKLILCPEHKSLRKRLNRQLQNKCNKESHVHHRKQKEPIATCPDCGKKHAVSVKINYSTIVPQIFCSACKSHRDSIDDTFI